MTKPISKQKRKSNKRGSKTTIHEFQPRTFGGLVRVMNKRQEFLCVHERFAGEY